MPTTKNVAMISSTARDLPDHRKQVIDACHRCTCDYRCMETLPASHDDAVQASLKLVDEADIYIGIFAHRYGYIPPGSEISITEIEYEQALKKGLPCLIFFIHDDHPLTKPMVETGPGAAKLETLKKRISEKHVAAFFKSPEDLRGHVLHAVQASLAGRASDGPPSLHFVHPIPKPPEPYIAHYYALLQTGKIIGRRAELDRLTQWITKSPNPMMHVIAIGGMGKSALTWHWFHHIAPQEWPKMKGRIWWSFYESDGHFENFVTRGLAYVSGQSEAEVRKLSLRDRMDALVRILQTEPFLVVLDGLERLLTAYARMDAPYVKDDDLDEKTLNAVMDAQGYPQGFYQATVGRHQLRLAADPNVGRFLKILCQFRESRVLTSSRLFPADLQMNTGQAITGCDYNFLQGLSEGDALELWREYGCSGSSEKMLPIFCSFGFHPLVLKVFAGKVANYRMAPGDFDKWHEANPDFKPYGELVQVQSHILQHSLRDLSDAERRTLNMIAALRMATGIETLQAVLVDEESHTAKNARTSGRRLESQFATLGELDAVLTLLEDRGLLGWDRQSNRYDLHPIVRGVVWDLVQADNRQHVCETLRSHFAAFPKKHWEEVESLDELTYAIELYDKLIVLGRNDDACNVFKTHLDDATILRLSAGQMRLGFLERLFSARTDQLPRLQSVFDRYYVLNALAQSYARIGRPGKAAEVYQRVAELCGDAKDKRNQAVALCNVSSVRAIAGHLRQAEDSVYEALLLARKRSDAFREAVSLLRIGVVCGLKGQNEVC